MPGPPSKPNTAPGSDRRKGLDKTPAPSASGPLLDVSGLGQAGGILGTPAPLSLLSAQAPRQPTRPAPVFGPSGVLSPDDPSLSPVDQPQVIPETPGQKAARLALGRPLNPREAQSVRDLTPVQAQARVKRGMSRPIPQNTGTLQHYEPGYGARMQIGLTRLNDAVHEGVDDAQRSALALPTAIYQARVLHDPQAAAANFRPRTERTLLNPGGLPDGPGARPAGHDATGAFVRSLGGQLAPNAAGMVGFTATAPIGMGLMSPFVEVPGIGPALVGAGGLVTGTMGALGAGAAVKGIQEKTLEGLLGHAANQARVDLEARDAQQDPTAVRIGGYASQVPLAFANPASFVSRGTMRQAVGNALVGGVQQAANGVGQTLLSGQTPTWQDAAMDFGAGMLLNGQNTRMGDLMQNAGGAVGKKMGIAPRAQAAAMRVAPSAANHPLLPKVTEGEGWGDYLKRSYFPTQAAPPAAPLPPAAPTGQLALQTPSPASAAVVPVTPALHTLGEPVAEAPVSPATTTTPRASTSDVPVSAPVVSDPEPTVLPPGARTAVPALPAPAIPLALPSSPAPLALPAPSTPLALPAPSADNAASISGAAGENRVPGARPPLSGKGKGSGTPTGTLIPVPKPDEVTSLFSLSPASPPDVQDLQTIEALLGRQAQKQAVTGPLPGIHYLSNVAAKGAPSANEGARLMQLLQEGPQGRKPIKIAAGNARKNAAKK